MRCTKCGSLTKLILHRSEEYGRPEFTCRTCDRHMLSEISRAVWGNVNGNTVMSIGYDAFAPMILREGSVNKNEMHKV